jgi:hypothetical protein
MARAMGLLRIASASQMGVRFLINVFSPAESDQRTATKYECCFSLVLS